VWTCLPLLVLAALLLAGSAAPLPAAEEEAPESEQTEAEQTKAEKKQADKEKKEAKKAEKEAKKRAKRRAKMEKQAEKAKKKGLMGGKYKGTTVDGLLDKAQQYLDAKKWYKAQEILLFLDDNEAARAQQNRVKLLLADSYFGQGGTLNLVESLARYRTFLTFFPSDPKADHAQYHIAMAYFKQAPKFNRDQSPTENALFEFQKMLELYPGSELAPEAEQRIREARNLLAESEFGIGVFYFKWKAWEAAVGRFQTVLSEFPEYAKKAQVYRMLAQAYYKMGAKVEGDIYARKFQEEGGKSLEAKAGAGDKKAAKAAKNADKAAAKAEKAAKKAEKQAQKQAEKEAKKKEKDKESEEKAAPEAEEGGSS
jgi:outer membrane assembly lipoprotein YfiO